MQVFKKCIAISILGIIIFSSVPIDNNLYALNKSSLNKKSINNESIESILNSKQYQSIKKVNLDSKGNPIDSELININNKTSLSDGVYTMDYKEGWVLGKDKGFLKSIIIPAGATGGLQTSETKGFESTIKTQVTASFGTEFIKAVVKVGYGYNFGESMSIVIDQSIKSPKDKNLFVKAQTIYRRFDVLRVKNNKIIDRAISYQPVSFAFRELAFSNGEKVIQSKLYETNDRNILGEPDYDIKHVIDPETQFEGDAVLSSNKEDFWSTKRRVSTTPVGIYFTPSITSRYEISDNIYGYGWAGKPKKSGVSLKLYKFNSDNSIELIASRDRKITELVSDDFAAPPLIVPELKAGQKYILLINEERHAKFFETIPNRPEDISYRIRFRR